MEEGVEERHEALRLAFLATIAGESIFFLGPPGVAKSLVARRIKHAFRDARSFEYLMGRFSTPEEIFGPISIQRLKNDDTYERVTESYLPDADIVFLDEIWKASPPIQNALLTALNERTFRNGSREVTIPMKGLLAAANELPEDDATVQAFWDRFLLRLELHPVREDAAFRRMITSADDLYRDSIDAELKVTQEEYHEWQHAIAGITVPESVLSALTHLRRRIGQVNAERSDQGESPIYISDRRWKKMVRILRASAFLNGRDHIDLLDLLLLQHCLWNTRNQRRVIQGLLEEALHHAQPERAVDPRHVARALGTLRREIRDALVGYSEETRLQPTFYRNEYVRLKGFQEPFLALVWHGDIEAMEEHEEDQIDVFLYEDDATLARTTEVTATLAGWTLQIDGRPYEIETRPSTDTVAVVRDPTEEEEHAWQQRLEEVDQEARRAIEHAEASRASAHEGAVDHLFVHRSYAGSAYASIDDAAEQLRRLRIAIGKTKESLQSGSRPDSPGEE
jgi:MoxR-like ATPase